MRTNVLTKERKKAKNVTGPRPYNQKLSKKQQGCVLKWFMNMFTECHVLLVEKYYQRRHLCPHKTSKLGRLNLRMDQQNQSETLRFMEASTVLALRRQAFHLSRASVLMFLLSSGFMILCEDAGKQCQTAVCRCCCHLWMPGGNQTL